MTMSNARNNPAAVQTINAAAAAIITADIRTQPTIAQKKRWGSCWSPYMCFGLGRTSKRIGHAVLVPEPVHPPAAPNPLPPATSAVSFIAPPSSPASFLQSNPPSIPQSPTKLLSLASLSAASHSTSGSAPAFSIGPYAYETQLVSPPVFSTFTTEPSTAAYTPPPESVQATRPSSPDVPFAQLVASSLERTRKKCVPQQFYYPGSPGSQLKSPGSGVTNSGTSSPFPDKPRSVKILGFEHFLNRKCGSRLGSGSVTPDGPGLWSRLGSGSLTPCQEIYPVDEQIVGEVGSAFNSESGPRNEEDAALMVHHRVSFELTGEDVARCLESKSAAASFRTPLEFPDTDAPEGSIENQCLVTVRSGKEFNFMNAGEHFTSQPESSSGSEWWAHVKASARDSKSRNGWSFFPFLGPQVS
ncbi:hypothetical protein SAY87_030823 [Trapa incisa]|uniref:Hydroxyproline-rich glycoprotein family protein n=1 Tax=Trapa incisa TaxID=236973 RepID=A0AAN7KN73_9MYRT|nr:hypothetical protein SAY87_030823 [Trapa incisa]